MRKYNLALKELDKILIGVVNMRFTQSSLFASITMVLLSITGCYGDSETDNTQTTPQINLIPTPVELNQSNGNWNITNKVKIQYNDEELRDEAKYLADKLKENNGLSLDIEKASNINQSPRAESIEIVIDPNITESEEGYVLNIFKDKARLTGATESGVFYGIQSLIRLLPLNKTTMPIVNITDYPRFSWRGIHLDVARHYFSIENIKKLLDQMAFLKLNKFHWHLTDDQGWRIEINNWPKLTETGSCRESSPPYGNRNGKDGIRTCGYYTQEQVKDIVAYAEARHIQVIPEIDLPGHMSAAIAAYPELGVSDIKSFKPKVQVSWGVFPYLLNTKDTTFNWIDQVFSQLVELFPNSSYIHLGGDEAKKDQWKESTYEQNKIKELGLKGGEDDLQSWFISKVEDIITSKGYIAVGWDEIMEGGKTPGVGEISKDTVIMAWRGQEHGKKAAEKGHPVVMSAGLYFDHYQAPEEIELAKGPEYESICCLSTVKDVYNYEPIPTELSPEYYNNILGAQGQLWSEYMHTWEKVEYQAFPRTTALSEMLWSPKDKRDYNDFKQRLNSIFSRYEAAGINYRDVYESDNFKLDDGTSVTWTFPNVNRNELLKTRDANDSTFFSTNSTPDINDNITYKLRTPINDRYISVLTGSPDITRKNILQYGVLEVSSDGEEWIYIADFKDGEAYAKYDGSISYIRLRVTQQQDSLLSIREVSYSQSS